MAIGDSVSSSNKAASLSDNDNPATGNASSAAHKPIAHTPHRRDRFAALLGFLVFAGGLVMLGFVFQTAYRLFNTPLDDWFRQTTKGAPKLQDLAGVGTLVAIRVALLAIMAVVGSLVTNRGMQMYFSSSRPHTTK